MPIEVNRARVADFLVQHLEGIDDTSTFYRQIHRLPPAHLLEITPGTFTKRRYWELTPREELVLDSDAEYARAFWNELSIAVGRRHRDTRKTAVMLSGGLDSSSIVAAALELDPEERRAIRTISIVADREPHCIESKCIEAVIAEDSIKSRVLSIDHLAAYQDPLLDSLRGSTDPFDFWMTLPRMIYLASHRAGFTRVIDGVDGDLVVSHGASLIASLLRQGRCLRAMEEARGQSHFHDRERSAIDILVAAARQAWVPERLRKGKRSRAQETWLANHLEGSVIHPDFAVEVGLTDRLERLEAQRRSHLDDLRRDQANLISHPYTVAALERYHRAASAFGIEPLHPYFDRELVEFCLSLPLDQRVKCGWTKYVVRQAAQGKLPTDVVWRKGDWRRLNTEVTERVVAFHRERIGDLIASGLGDGLKGWVDEGLVRASWEAYLGNAGRDATEVVWQVAALAMWLEGTGSKKASGGLI
ncbi:MAG: asparagine synthase-related protein [Acidobacteriota bacterium]